jgi:hypothetical protein
VSLSGRSSKNRSFYVDIERRRKRLKIGAYEVWDTIGTVEVNCGDSVERTIEVKFGVSRENANKISLTLGTEAELLELLKSKAELTFGREFKYTFQSEHKEGITFKISAPPKGRKLNAILQLNTKIDGEVINYPSGWALWKRPTSYPIQFLIPHQSFNILSETDEYDPDCGSPPQTEPSGPKEPFGPKVRVSLGSGLSYEGRGVQVEGGCIYRTSICA